LLAARSWRFGLGALTAIGAIAVASLILLPGWPVEFWRSTQRYAAAAHPLSAAAVLGDVTRFGAAGAACLGATALLLIAYGWWASHRLAGDALACGALASIWLVPPLYEWNSVVLLVPIVIALRIARFHGGGAERALLLGLVVAALATAVAYARWPSAARAAWPVIALALFVWSERRGAVDT
jgi:hypothetical protein